jgi:hypothetical protein
MDCETQNIPLASTAYFSRDANEHVNRSFPNIIKVGCSHDQLLCLPSCLLPIHLSNCFSYSQTFISTPLQCAGLYRLSFVDWLNCGIGLFDEARRSNRDRLLTAASYPSGVDMVVHLFLVNIPLIVMLSCFVLRATSRFRGTVSCQKFKSEI